MTVDITIQHSEAMMAWMMPTLTSRRRSMSITVDDNDSAYTADVVLPVSVQGLRSSMCAGGGGGLTHPPTSESRP